jgi:guanylate kinase
MLIILSAPSGGGKSTIMRALLSKDASLAYSVSATTRPARHDEKNGREYHFYSREDFQHLIDEDAFLEYFEVHGNFYGTLKREVDSKIQSGKDVLLDVDVQGSMRLKKLVPDCTTIFVLPPSMATLERRLRNRGTDNEDVIRRRLDNASGEIRMAEHYDYVLINENLDETIANVHLIIRAQRFRASRVMLHDALGSVLSPSGKA